MNRSKITKAKEEAERLLERIGELESCAGWYRPPSQGVLGGWYTSDCQTKLPDDQFSSGRYTASVRRASMDLTRALAELRK